MRTLRLTRLAATDIIEIHDWLSANRSPDAALHVVRGLHHTIDEIVASPERGGVHPSIRVSGVRRRLKWSYLIAYEFDDHVVTILRVVHGARELENITWR